ncbi:hypothetical protein V7O66_05760 [Methanolobus sp. ZRKC3]|uniref:hypothetical protein n=1 Tax=Methanolobus sp. ZRKC3 TaxID=3125786 RepID=UPI0032536434
MKKIAVILLAGMLMATMVGVGIVNAAAEDTDNTAVFGPMYIWAGNQMRAFGGYGSGYCPGFGYYANDGDITTTSIELEVETVEEAVKIAEDATGQDISENNVYQMGRWWVFSYTDDEGVIKQSRIDAFTGEVVEDFYEPAYQGQQSRQNGRYMRGGNGYGGGCGGAGYRY